MEGIGSSVLAALRRVPHARELLGRIMKTPSVHPDRDELVFEEGKVLFGWQRREESRTKARSALFVAARALTGPAPRSARNRRFQRCLCAARVPSKFPSVSLERGDLLSPSTHFLPFVLKHVYCSSSACCFHFRLQKITKSC